jgi:hypothetical protein
MKWVKQTVWHLLQNNQHDRTHDPYNKSGVYQLKCSECKKRYIGQTGSPFNVRYKEHAREFRHGTNKSNYAKHLLDNRHPLQPIYDCMEILHPTTTTKPELHQPTPVKTLK